VIARVTVVFGIKSMSNAMEIARGEVEYYLLLYECYSSQIPQLPVLLLTLTIIGK